MRGSGLRLSGLLAWMRRLARLLPAITVSASVHAGGLPAGSPPPPGGGDCCGAPSDNRPAPVLRGLYLPAGRLVKGPSDAEWAAWREAGLNAVVVDLKNDEGWVLAPVDVPEVGSFRARWSPGLDLAGFAARARREGFYPVARIVARLANGNVYVNRNMIGAVVGVQPFGGTGLSGTGPKAGGPDYLKRFTAEQTVTVNTAAAGGNASLLVGEG